MDKILDSLGLHCYVIMVHFHLILYALNCRFMSYELIDCCLLFLLNWQAMMEIYNMYRSHFVAKNIVVLFGALQDVASHAHKINNNTTLR